MDTSAEQQIPHTGFLRLHQLIGRKGTDEKPAIPAIIPLSKSSLWRLIAAGKFPKGVKLSAGVTAWRADDIRAYIEQASA